MPQALSNGKSPKFTHQVNPFPEDKFKALDRHDNDKKFSKREENVVEKGEIARFEQFLLCQQCFQKTCTADTSKQKIGNVLRVGNMKEI